MDKAESELSGPIDVVACDVGSTKRDRFGWAHVRWEPAGSELVSDGTTLDECAEAVADRLRADVRVSLGFESPMWVPVPETSAGLSTGRSGEGSRSMFAPAGGYVTTLGIHQAAWLLREIRRKLERTVRCAVTLETWEPGSLFLWEAFVSGDAHADASASDSHVADARTAAMEFAKELPDVTSSLPQPESEQQAFSLFAALLMWGHHHGWVEVDSQDVWAVPVVVQPDAVWTPD